MTFGSKLAHGHFWRQPQSERGVLARIQVQSRLFRTNVLFFCSQRFNAAVRVYIYIIFIYIHICCQGSGWSLGLCQVRGAFASLSRAAVIEARQRCLIFGTVDRRRVPCACFTVHRPLRGLFLFSAACAMWCCFRHLCDQRKFVDPGLCMEVDLAAVAAVCMQKISIDGFTFDLTDSFFLYHGRRQHIFTVSGGGYYPETKKCVD